MKMNVFELAEKLSLKKINISDGKREIKRGYAGDLLSHVMVNGFKDSAWVTVMTNVNVSAVASLLNVSCVILCDGLFPDKDMLTAAEKHEINVLSSEKTMYDICCDMREVGI